MFKLELWLDQGSTEVLVIGKAHEVLSFRGQVTFCFLTWAVVLWMCSFCGDSLNCTLAILVLFLHI